MNKIFYSKCLYPTTTITAGKDYVIEDDSDDKLTIINDHGNRISLMKYRFGEIQLKEIPVKENMKKVICILAHNFKSITKGNSYELIKESPDFFYINNNLNTTKRYAKKYFKHSLVEDVKESPKKELAFCIYPVINELTFKEGYDFKSDKKDKNLIIVTNDKTISKSYLKKRFNIEMG